MMCFHPKDKLPENTQYTLTYFPDRPWNDLDAKTGNHKWVVVKFIRGISKEERAALSEDDVRKKTYTGADEVGNNLVPYCWKPLGPVHSLVKKLRCGVNYRRLNE